MTGKIQRSPCHAMTNPEQLFNPSNGKQLKNLQSSEGGRKKVNCKLNT